MSNGYHKNTGPCEVSEVDGQKIGDIAEKQAGSEASQKLRERHSQGIGEGGTANYRHQQKGALKK